MSESLIEEVDVQRELAQARILITEDTETVTDLLPPIVRMARGTSDDDGGVLLARSSDEGMAALDTITNGMEAGDRIIHIADLEIPTVWAEGVDDYDQKDIRDTNGLAVIHALQKRVSEWNTAHTTEAPIRLQIFVNSTRYKSRGEFEEHYGTKVDMLSIVGGMEEGSDKCHVLVSVQELLAAELAGLEGDASNSSPRLAELRETFNQRLVEYTSEL